MTESYDSFKKNDSHDSVIWISNMIGYIQYAKQIQLLYKTICWTQRRNMQICDSGVPRVS